MAGREVNRSNLDQAAADAIIAVREAFRQVQTVKAYLAQVGKTDTYDPLTQSTTATGAVDPTIPAKSTAKTTTPTVGKFGYTDDEAYLLRSVFDQLAALNVQPILDTARKLTGLS